MQQKTSSQVSSFSSFFENITSFGHYYSTLLPRSILLVQQTVLNHSIECQETVATHFSAEELAQNFLGDGELFCLHFI
jgi:hypothetical protein